MIFFIIHRPERRIEATHLRGGSNDRVLICLDVFLPHLCRLYSRLATTVYLARCTTTQPIVFHIMSLSAPLYIYTPVAVWREKRIASCRHALYNIIRCGYCFSNRRSEACKTARMHAERAQRPPAPRAGCYPPRQRGLPSPTGGSAHVRVHPPHPSQRGECATRIHDDDRGHGQHPCMSLRHLTYYSHFSLTPFPIFTCGDVYDRTHWYF